MDDKTAPPQYSTPPPAAQAYPGAQPQQQQHAVPQGYHQQQQQQPQPYQGQVVQHQQPQQYAVQPAQQPYQVQPGQQIVYHAPQPGQPGQPLPPQQQQLPQQQPQQHPPQQYQAQQPMQLVVPPNADKWQASLMDCTPCESCCLGCFLPCILYGKTADRIRDPSMRSADACNSDCMLMGAVSCFTGCGWILVHMKRAEIRERFGIAGNGGEDCCTAYWCPCCALIQQDNEVALRLPSTPAAAVQQQPQGYAAQPGMQMPPMQQPQAVHRPTQ